ncbi:MAG: hypothetical protein ACI4V7_09565 [Succinivibrionaceae bacterium]
MNNNSYNKKEETETRTYIVRFLDNDSNIIHRAYIKYAQESLPFPRQYFMHGYEFFEHSISEELYTTVNLSPTRLAEIISRMIRYAFGNVISTEFKYDTAYVVFECGIKMVVYDYSLDHYSKNTKKMNEFKRSLYKTVNCIINA